MRGIALSIQCISVSLKREVPAQVAQEDYDFVWHPEWVALKIDRRRQSEVDRVGRDIAEVLTRSLDERLAASLMACGIVGRSAPWRLQLVARAVGPASRRRRP